MILNLLNRFASAIGVVIVILLGAQYEERFMPIIKDFKVTKIERTSTGWRAWGTYHKVRVCELISSNVVAYGDGPAKLLLQVKPFDAPLGLIEWGPYDIPVANLPFTRVQVISTHKCHPFWAQQAVYFEIKADQLP
jgi:hypothetical protein